MSIKRLLPVAFLLLLMSAVASAAPRESRVPLHNGVLQIHDLNAILCSELHLPNCPDHDEVDLTGANGSEFLFAVNACLWNGTSLEVESPSTAVVRFNHDSNFGKCDALRRLSRVYFAETSPHATAAQARNWGLLFPQPIDPHRPLVVLIHGLDSNRYDCGPMGDLLQHAGYQIAYFSYPGDQPIADSAALLGRSLQQLQSRFPGVRIDIITHSMGGLVARQYIEGPDYSGNIDHLIMVAPPNDGSNWARFRILLSAAQNYHLHKENPDWRWTWLLTEGMGEAGDDLLPGSTFLKELNALPRRASVKYTIVAGNRSSVHEVEGNCAATVSHWLPQRTRNWWGFRQCFAGLQRAATHFHEEPADNDGPVTLKSTQLPGVTDYVVLPGNHVSLYLPVDGSLPLAWPVIKDRLAK